MQNSLNPCPVRSKQLKTAMLSLSLKVLPLMIDGHYQLALPWRCNPPCFPNSHPAAEHRLDSLIRRLLKDLSPKKKYCKTVNGYITKGHARRVPDNQISAVF